MSECPDCETDNVQSWVYVPDNSDTEKLVVECHECGKTFEREMSVLETRQHECSECGSTDVESWETWVDGDRVTKLKCNDCGLVEVER